jgi:aarF domain-containing kinase
MEYCEGEKLSNWIQSQPDMADRDRLSKKMLDLFMVEFLEWKLVQTDPNFGNYLVQTNPLKVVLLDFGSSMRFSDEFIKDYLHTIILASEEKKSALISQAIDFHLLHQDESDETKDAFYQMMRVSMEPFLSASQPFDFSSIDYERRTRDSVLLFTKLLKFSPPPRKILFLHRKLGGLFNLLKRLEVKINLHPYWGALIGEER